MKIFILKSSKKYIFFIFLGEIHLQNEQTSLPIDQDLEVENSDYDPGVHEEGYLPEEAPVPTAPAVPVAPADPAAPIFDQIVALAQPALPAIDGTDQPPLDPTLLAALGESTSDTPEYGTSVHDSLANLWLPILKKGLAKENKETLLKEYLIPNNCKLLQAPKLNAEISAAVTEVVRGRDKKYVAVQQQLGRGIAAVSRAMDVLLKSENKVEALKYLSDGCRILSDAHNFITRDRIKLITPSLEKNFLHVIQDTERDESLFGNTLSEKIKASKAIERQGQQIKKTVSAPKPGTSNSTNTRAFIPQGNWSGPPRYSSNRGGRGGYRRTNPSPATRRPYVNTAASTRQPAPTKSRALAHQ
ncbi:uncharacterized protein LOC133531288 [Cydia pomonella]|uniref:uncharacterized protein LOC133531288 n=1 Tax=Cydia pomonella TaxID=82600 RepID=UPI002ADE64BD|nr:uncharacterized protein LOC133531288 [Cydia pomonella]